MQSPTELPVSRVKAALPAVTIVIEWENAIDVADQWTGRAMAALEREMAAVAGKSEAPPRLLYLYDSKEVERGTVEQAIERMAPRLRDSRHGRGRGDGGPAIL